MLFSWCIAWPMFRTDQRVQLKPEEWDIALVPSMNPGKVKSGTVDGSEGFGISAFSKQREAAGEYLKFWQSDQKQKEILIEAGWLPWSLKVLDDPQVQTNGAARVFREQSKYPMSRFGAPWYTEVQDILGRNVMRAVQGQQTVDQALDDTAAKAKEIITKHQAQKR
jgi:multiple sugar transport system substrate-binding protein